MKNTNKINSNQKIICMCLVLKAMTMPGLKSRMHLRNIPVEITGDSVVFKYCMDGNLRFFDFYKGEEGALVLQERGIITRFEGVGKKLRMYRKKIHAEKGHNGVPRMWESESAFDWEDILALPGYQLLEIVANWEYELIGRIGGFIPYKPKARIRDFNKIDHTPTPGKSIVVHINRKKAA